MDVNSKEKTTFKELLHLLSTIFSWTIFVLLLLCAIFLIYYFIATKIFASFGSKYEPKFSLYSIMSGSMTPNINVYDVVVDVRVDNPEDIKIGDVITFISNSNETKGMTITHRVVSINKNNDGTYSYQTKGDYNPIADSSRVDFNSIIGKVTLKIPKLGKLQTFVASSTGLILIALSVSLFILLKSLLRKLKEQMNLAKSGPLTKLFTKKLYLPYTKNFVPIGVTSSSKEINKVEEEKVETNQIKEDIKESQVDETSLAINENLLNIDYGDEEIDIDLPDLK